MVAVSVHANACLARELVRLVGRLVVRESLLDLLVAVGLVDPRGEGSPIGYGIGVAVAVNVGGVEPEDEVRNGVLVEQGVGGNEGIDGAPYVAAAVRYFGGEIISGALGQTRELVRNQADIMGAGEGHVAVPDVAVGGTVVVAPVKTHGGRLTALVDDLKVWIRVLVRMTGDQVALQSPLPSQPALDVRYLGVG